MRPSDVRVGGVALNVGVLAMSPGSSGGGCFSCPPGRPFPSVACPHTILCLSPIPPLSRHMARLPFLLRGLQAPASPVLPAASSWNLQVARTLPAPLSRRLGRPAPFFLCPVSWPTSTVLGCSRTFGHTPCTQAEYREDLWGQSTEWLPAARECAEGAHLLLALQ